MKKESGKVVIFTDGACEPNPGPGGYGAVLNSGKRTKSISGGFRKTTNNRMELLAAIKALETLKYPCNVVVHSDSKYLVDTMAQSKASRWEANNWRLSSKRSVVNVDLWQELLKLCKTHQVEFMWVKGHAGILENEQADKLSYAALKADDLPADKEYEKLSHPQAELAQVQHTAQEKTSVSKIKMTYAGQPCRKCGTLVEKRIPRRKRKKDQAYYYEYYLRCPSCKTMYMVEEAKRWINKPGALL